MLRSDDGQVTRLEDYRPTDFAIRHVEMTVRLFDGHAEVDASLSVERRAGVDGTAPLVLDGDEVTLVSLHVDGEPVDPSTYDLTDRALTVRDLPQSGAFTLRIETRVEPERNTKLMGLYRSGGVWCTQCEAEGFRRITFFLDRPDVLATYRVRIEADRGAAPILLSNGNPAERGDLADGRHFAVWDDPFPKPAYLFAIVAGDLDVLTDSFTTMSGRTVALAIYTEKGLSRRAAYAMDAVKRSMRWDETRFGREYDLEMFNIVAISDFNMGAMENKGLNVFNHKYVLLDPDTATDADYAGVETVIAHEYFHNWTGNRITCRDWFQLCLKEGLTVYRDQEFTADERSSTVKRIASVSGLKAHQFPEDGGPLQHPVRPSTYREINNFYTSTVYDKGAEVVRMLATILGADAFRAGMDLYFERHDGDAATIEDFLRCFADVSGTDLSQFALWYAQAGTPTLTVEEAFDPGSGRLTLSLRQELAEGAAGTGTAPMHLPVRFGLVGSNGQDMDARPAAGSAEVDGDLIHLTTPDAVVVFESLSERPMVSLLRDFSAPVTLRSAQSEADRLALARLDPNAFGRWRALSDALGDALRNAARAVAAGRDGRIDNAVLDAVIASCEDESLEPALRAQMASVQGEAEIARLIGAEVDPDAVHAVRATALRLLGERGAKIFRRVRDELGDAEEPFSPSAAATGRRALRNALLLPLAVAGDLALARDSFAQARNMTDRLAALTVLAHHFPDETASEEALAAFFESYEDDALVVDKWFTLQATVPRAETVGVVERLTAHPKFKLANPNRARALIGGFASGNQRAFNAASGAGYEWVADRLVELDRLNPQTAARLATSFRSWRSFDAARQNHARAALAGIADTAGISVDLRDIVERTLA